jgi:hypothetical protein
MKDRDDDTVTMEVSREAMRIMLLSLRYYGGTFVNPKSVKRYSGIAEDIEERWNKGFAKANPPEPKKAPAKKK